MKTLILDSATNILYTCLLDDKEIVYETYVKGKNDHASSILVEVNNAITKLGITLRDLDNVIVGYGPGSYTGVRMAVTVGKMIATMEPKIKLSTISTLLLMGSGQKGIMLIDIDARRGNCFGCIYDFKNLKYVVEESLILKETLLANNFEKEVNENEFKVDPFVVVKLAKLVDDPRLVVPNYLRDTEAERNLHD